MTGELLVDTGLLRAAADMLDDACILFAQGAGRHESSPLTDDSLGRSPVAREVIESASRRVLEAMDASSRIAEAAGFTADRIRAAAASFDRAEAAIAAPR